MADWGGGFQDWTTVLPLLVRPGPDMALGVCLFVGREPSRNIFSDVISCALKNSMNGSFET